MSILVTGGAGFIGSNFVRDWCESGGAALVSLDKLTYAGNLRNLEGLPAGAWHEFVHGDIADRDLVAGLLERHAVTAVVNFAAESHVDRSIHGPEDFIQTNIVGTFRAERAIHLVRAHVEEPERRLSRRRQPGPVRAHALKQPR